MEQLGAWGGAELLQAFTELSLELLEVHVDRTLAPGGDEDGCWQRSAAV